MLRSLEYLSLRGLQARKSMSFHEDSMLRSAASQKGSNAALLCFAACAMQHRLQIALLGVSSLDLGRSATGRPFFA